MTENKELKPKSFRISDEIAEKFRSISSTIGGNQQETLAKLIEAYEFQSGKMILTDKKADIEQFENYVSCITRMYMGTLEDNQNITEMVRCGFEAQLISKDKVILDLQERLQQAQQNENVAKENEQKLEREFISVQNKFKESENEFKQKNEELQEKLADKDALNKVLTENCNSFKEASMENQKLKKRIQELENENFTYQKKITLIEKEKDEEILELKKKHIQEIEYYQERYKILMYKKQENFHEEENENEKK